MNFHLARELNRSFREITDALMGMLQKEHNFELMLVAARCLRNLLEAFPRSHPVVVQAVPILLHKVCPPPSLIVMHCTCR